MNKLSDAALRIYGVEPEWDTNPYKRLLKDDPDWAIAKAINWYNANAKPKDNKRWILAYMRGQRFSKANIDRVKRVDLKRFRFDFDRIGFLARMSSNGCKLPTDKKKRLKEGIKRFIAWGAEKQEQAKERAAETDRPTVQDRMKAQVNELLTDLEAKLDEFVEGIGKRTLPRQWYSMAKFLKDRDVKGKQTTMIADHFRATHDEAQTALDKGDPQLVEGYDFLTRPQLKRLVKFLEAWIIACEAHGATKRKSRKPRKKKVKTPAELTAKVQYMKRSKEFKVSSVDPKKIIGADCVIVLNTKYRFFTIYRAKDAAGLTVKGTTIKDFCTTKSKERRLRNPKPILAAARKMGLRAINAEFKNVRTKDRKPTGRLNKHCVILRIL